MALRVLIAPLACMLIGCSENLVPIYEPNVQPGISFYDYENRSKRHQIGQDGYFTRSEQPRPVFLVFADPSGKVKLHVGDQRYEKSEEKVPFHVLCDTARLVIGTQRLEPSKVLLAVGDGSWRVASCSDKILINGEDKANAVWMEFHLGMPVPDTFSLELPQSDFGSGPTERTEVAFTKRMVREVTGGFN